MQTYYLVRKSKEDSIMMTQKNQWNQPFLGKNPAKDFDLAILKINKSTMIEWKIKIDLNPKSKATSSRTY